MGFSSSRFFRIERRDLAYLKFVIEAYDGLAVVSTVDRDGPLIRIQTTPSLVAELDRLLIALAQEIAMTESAPPPLTGGANPGVHHV